MVVVVVVVDVMVVVVVAAAAAAGRACPHPGFSERLRPGRPSRHGAARAGGPGPDRWPGQSGPCRGAGYYYIILYYIIYYILLLLLLLLPMMIMIMIMITTMIWIIADETGRPGSGCTTTRRR